MLAKKCGPMNSFGSRCRLSRLSLRVQTFFSLNQILLLFFLLNLVSNTSSPMTLPCQVFSPRYFTCGDSQHQRCFLKGRNGIPPGISGGAKKLPAGWFESLGAFFFVRLKFNALGGKRKNEDLSGRVSDRSLRKLRHRREDPSNEFCRMAFRPVQHISIPG